MLDHSVRSRISFVWKHGFSQLGGSLHQTLRQWTGCSLITPWLLHRGCSSGCLGSPRGCPSGWVHLSVRPRVRKRSGPAEGSLAALPEFYLIAGHSQGHVLRVLPETDTPEGWEIAVRGCMIALHRPLVGLVSERDVRTQAESWESQSFRTRLVMEGIETCVCVTGETFYAIVRQWCVVLSAAWSPIPLFCCRGLVACQINSMVSRRHVGPSEVPFLLEWGHGV